MPVTKTAQKALRQNFRRQARNLERKAQLKDLEKQTRKLLQKKDHQGAKALLPKYYKALDKAAKTGVIKKNTASRIKSRATKRVNRTA